MDMICRIAKKIRLSENYFTLMKLELVTGVIDTEGNLRVMDEQNDEIKIYPIYSDPDFLGSDNELCYCDERSRDGILSTIENVTTKSELFKKYKDITDSYFYIIYYDEETKTSETIRTNDASKIIELYEGHEELMSKSKFVTPNKCFSVTKDAIITNIDTVKNLSKMIEDENLTEATDILDTMIEDYNTANCIEEEEDLGVVSAIKALQEQEEANEESNYEELNLPDRSLEDIMNELNSLIGMEDVKSQVNLLSNFLKWKQTKQEPADIKLDDVMGKVNLNMVFYGNSGTGKTTVAKLFSEILNKLGYANGKFKEVKANDFIAEYVGQTGPKTEKLLKEIRGGVLFLDEAYALTTGIGEKTSSFGQDAISVLLKEMEKGQTIFIFAGYRQETEEFIDSNSGLKSRIGKCIEFKDYTIEELFKMFLNKINKANLLLTQEASDAIIKLIENAITQKNFGNGRYIKNLFESIIIEHSNNTLDSDDKNVLRTITIDDINTLETSKILYKKLEGNKIGF